MSDKEETIVLPNGTRKTFPAGTSDEYIDNWTERAFNRIESQQKNWADRDPMDFARVMAGRGSAIGNVVDFLKETTPRYPESMPLVGGQPMAPSWAGRGALGRNPVIGLGDLATAGANIAAGALDTPRTTEMPSLLDAPLPPGIEQPRPSMTSGPVTGPLPRLTPPSAAIGELIGLKPQAPDAGYLERFLEAITSVARNPLTGGAPSPGSAAGVADASIPYAARADRPGDVIDQVMTQVAPEARRMAANRVAGSVGRGASAAGSVLGGDVGQAVGGDLGALLGSLAGGMTPNVTSALVRTPTRAHYARPGDQSERALQTQEELGIDPTPGATGNKRMSMLENTAARAPIPFNPAALRQERTAQQFEDAAMGTLNRIEDQGPLIQTPDVTGTQMRVAANAGTANLDDYFRRGYAIVDQGVPPETLVRPRETYRTAIDMAGPTSAESAATNRVIGQALEANVEPSVVQRERLVQQPPVPAPGQPRFGPLEDQPPNPVTETGVPYPKARPTGTDLFHSQERQNPSAAGAIGILRRAFAGDTAEALINDPFMVQAFPNLADRVAKAERLRVLASEYSRENATGRDTTQPTTYRPGQGGPTGGDITQMDPGSMPPGTASYPMGGGSYGVLDQISEAQTGPSAFTIGKDPDRMAVLQRTAQADYPVIARNVIGNQWQGPSGRVEPMAVARTWGPGKKGIGENAKSILANDDPAIVEQGNRLAAGGELFRERVAADTGSKTAPIYATMTAVPALAASPGTVIPAAIMAYASALGVSGDTLARYLARTNPQMFELMARKGSDAALMAAGQMADDQARAMREGTGFIEEGARAGGEAWDAYRRNLPLVSPVVPRVYDYMRGQ